MVARIKSGKSVRGVLSYNENKVKEGSAVCIDAVGFGCVPEELSFKNKLTRFTDLTARNKIAKTNTIHISLNFHPDEQLSEQRLKDISASYMEKIGFGDQPYLVYRHFDAAHDHIHIATVNIKSTGKRIDIHDIGKNKSELARKEIEKSFALIKAEEQESSIGKELKPADLTKAAYGKRPTKNEISNIVRTVLKYYRYASFKEYNTILKEYNVHASRGEPGTRMYETGGLVYQLLDRKTGEGIGVPIKSSSIYEKPTLKNIEARYESNRENKKHYRQRIMRTIDNALDKALDKLSFLSILKSENIIADFKTNEDGYTYGITFIDKTTCCFFNGSDIGKGYGAKSILEQLQTGTPAQNNFNTNFVNRLFKETDFSKDFKQILRDWMRSGLLVNAYEGEGGIVRYKAGHVSTDLESFSPVNKKMSRYFEVNRFGVYEANTIVDFVFKHLFPSGGYQQNTNDWRNIFPEIKTAFSSLLQQLWEPIYTRESHPIELLREARKKKRRRTG